MAWRTTGTATGSLTPAVQAQRPLNIFRVCITVVFNALGHRIVHLRQVGGAPVSFLQLPGDAYVITLQYAAHADYRWRARS